MKSNGSITSPTQAAMLTVSQGIFAMSLSEKNCVTLQQSIRSCKEHNAKDTPVPGLPEKKITREPSGITQENVIKKQRNILGRRRHSTTPATVDRQPPPRPRPFRNAKSLTEIEDNTEIIDGLFTTTLCSTEL